MRKIIIGAFVSLDGVMQGPGGPEEDRSGGFEHGGWVTQFWDDDLTEAMNATFAQEFDLLLGRRTYDIFAAHWPFVQHDPQASDFDALNHDIAVMFGRITKYVATHRPESLDWKNSETLGADVAARVTALKAEGDRDLLVQGSTELIQILLAHDLVDELRLQVMPVTLGQGKRLFGSGTRAGAFTLAAAKTGSTGVQQVTYLRAGAVPTGSFGLEPPTELEVERRKEIGA